MKRLLVNFRRSFLVIDFERGVISRHGDHGRLLARYEITDRQDFDKRFTSLDVEKLRQGAYG